MQPIHVAGTVVRLFAICLFIYTVNLLINSMIFFVSGETDFLSIFSIAIPVALLILSVGLWNFPISISRKITGIPLKNDAQELSFKSDEFLSICIFVLGVYFLYDLFGDSIYWFKFLNDPLITDFQTELSLSQKASLWSLGFQFIFVFLLLTGNRLIVKIYKALRYGG